MASAFALSGGPIEVAIVGEESEERNALERRARLHPGAVVVAADEPTDEIPLLAGRTPVDGVPAAYVCRNLACEKPVTIVDELDQALSR